MPGRSGIDTDPSHVRTVTQRMLDVLHDLPAIGKDSTAPDSMGSYKFRGIEAITANLKPLLAKHGILATPSIRERQDDVRQTRSGSNLYVTRLHVFVTFRGADGGEIVADAWGEGTDTGDKATQKAMTSAWKSLLIIAFCIADAESDTDQHEIEETRRPVATVERINEVRNAVIECNLEDWVIAQHFEWPWDDAACDQIVARVQSMLGEVALSQPELDNPAPTPAVARPAESAPENRPCELCGSTRSERVMVGDVWRCAKPKDCERRAQAAHEMGEDTEVGAMVPHATGEPVADTGSLDRVDGSPCPECGATLPDHTDECGERPF